MSWSNFRKCVVFPALRKLVTNFVHDLYPTLKVIRLFTLLLLWKTSLGKLVLKLRLDRSWMWRFIVVVRLPIFLLVSQSRLRTSAHHTLRELKPLVRYGWLCPKTALCYAVELKMVRSPSGAIPKMKQKLLVLQVLKNLLRPCLG